MAPRIKERMTLLLDDECLAKLNEIARRDEISKCGVLRQLIKWRFNMDIRRTPTCANGHACACPHMHGVAPTIPGDPDRSL